MEETKNGWYRVKGVHYYHFDTGNGSSACGQYEYWGRHPEHIENPKEIRKCHACLDKLAEQSK